MSEPKEPPCGPNADDRYCPLFWKHDAEIKRLHGVVRELLENTGLDDDEQAEFLDRAGIPDDDMEDAEASA